MVHTSPTYADLGRTIIKDLQPKLPRNLSIDQEDLEYLVGALLAQRRPKQDIISFIKNHESDIERVIQNITEIGGEERLYELR